MRKYLITILLAASLLPLISSASPKAADNKVTIKMSNFMFTPKQVTVQAGATVVWVNESGRHTVEADKGEFKSPVLTSGQSFEFKFDKPGRYAYHCGFHGEAGGKDMAGTVIVTAKK